MGYGRVSGVGSGVDYSEDGIRSSNGGYSGAGSFGKTPGAGLAKLGRGVPRGVSGEPSRLEVPALEGGPAEGETGDVEPHQKGIGFDELGP